jgi:hypothetical protein
MVEFTKDKLTVEESFWVMWYFLKEHYDLSGGTFDVSDILSASEPVPLIINGKEIRIPADSGMISFWNEAIEKYKKEGIPPLKSFR